MAHVNQTQCLVIGPMHDMRRYMTFVSEIRRLLPGCTVNSPTPEIASSITVNIFREIDRSDFVIADMTGNRPSVMYEVGICHSIGLPMVLVRDSSETGPENQRPFDTADLREIELDFNEFPIDERSATGTALKTALANCLALATSVDTDAGDIMTPVTAYYGSPISEVWPGPGLAYGYFRNFVKPLMERLSAANPHVLIGRDDAPEDARLIEGITGSDIVVELVVPDLLDNAKHSVVRRIAKSAGFLNAWVGEKDRPESRLFTLYARADGPARVTLVDICTAVGAADARIEWRANRQGGNSKAAMRERFERQEVARFNRALLSDLNRYRSDWDSPIRLVEWKSLLI